MNLNWRASSLITDRASEKEGLSLSLSHLPKRVTNTPTMREPSRPPIAKTDTVREYMRVKVSSLSPVPFRLTTVLL